MFSFLKGAPKESTTVHPAVGAALVRATTFPANQGSAVAPATLSATCKAAALDGLPPNATLRDQPERGKTSTAFLISIPGHAPLVIADVGEPKDHIELWEMTPGGTPRFAKQRTVQLDARQASWGAAFLGGVACLPANRVLVAVVYDAPDTRRALFVYDADAGSFTPLARIETRPDDVMNVSEAQVIAPEAELVLYYTGRTREGAEQYYNALNHLVLFDAQHPQGLEVLKLAAADGSVDRWTVVNKTLWLETTVRQKKNRGAHAVWSLDLSKVLPR